MTVNVKYTSVSLMLLTLPNVSLTSVTSAHLCQFAAYGESLIDTKLSKRYVIPLTGTFPILETIATDLGLYYLLSRRIFTKERMNNSEWPDRFKESVELICDIGNGKWPLINNSGTVVAGRNDLAEAFSDKQDFIPTFFEGPETLTEPDQEKIREELDDRDVNQDIFLVIP